MFLLLFLVFVCFSCAALEIFCLLKMLKERKGSHFLRSAVSVCLPNFYMDLHFPLFLLPLRCSFEPHSQPFLSNRRLCLGMEHRFAGFKVQMVPAPLDLLQNVCLHALGPAGHLLSAVVLRLQCGAIQGVSFGF